MSAQRLGVYGILLRDATETATLDGYRLAFAGHRHAGAVFATVIEAPGEQVVLGIVHTTAADILHRYDGIEGVNREHPENGLYRREYAEVAGADGEQFGCWVYVMNEPTEKAPDKWLVQRMILEYQRLDIPLTQLLQATREVGMV